MSKKKNRRWEKPRCLPTHFHSAFSSRLLLCVAFNEWFVFLSLTTTSASRTTLSGDANWSWPNRNFTFTLTNSICSFASLLAHELYAVSSKKAHKVLISDRIVSDVTWKSPTKFQSSKHYFMKFDSLLLRPSAHGLSLCCVRIIKTYNRLFVVIVHRCLPSLIVELSQSEQVRKRENASARSNNRAKVFCRR